MSKYTIEITETLQKQILIEANSESEAFKKISNLYKIGEIVLGAEDFVGAEIQLLADEK